MVVIFEIYSSIICCLISLEPAEPAGARVTGAPCPRAPAGAIFCGAPARARPHPRKILESAPAPARTREKF